MNENKEMQLPEQLLAAVNGGVSVTPLDGDALNDLAAQKCPCCKQSLAFVNERSMFAGSGTTLRYFVCFNCVKVYEQRVYSSGIVSSDWGEVIE